jgi:hypothetical protein
VRTLAKACLKGQAGQMFGSLDLHRPKAPGIEAESMQDARSQLRSSHRRFHHADPQSGVRTDQAHVGRAEAEAAMLRIFRG